MSVFLTEPQSKNYKTLQHRMDNKTKKETKFLSIDITAYRRKFVPW